MQDLSFVRLSCLPVHELDSNDDINLLGYMVDLTILSLLRGSTASSQ